MGWASQRSNKQSNAASPDGKRRAVARTADTAADSKRRHKATTAEEEGDPKPNKPEPPVTLPAPPAMGFLGDTLRQIIDGGVEAEEKQARLLANLEEDADDEFAAVADRYRETPYLAQLAATHRARAQRARQWRPRYLAAFAISGNHTWSCDTARVSHTTVDAHRKNYPSFAAQVFEAERRASDLLFGACFKSAVEGDCRPVYQQGVCVGYVKEYDTRLRIEMLRALLPHQFKTLGVSNVTVNTGQPFTSPLICMRPIVADLLHQCFRRLAARLAEADPSNAGLQRDLSVSQDRIGDVLRGQGDLAGALKAYRESFAVAVRLAEADPSNAGLQRDLFVGYWKMADMAEKSGTGNAREWWRKAYEQLSTMNARGIMLPADEQYLAVLRQKAGVS